MARYKIVDRSPRFLPMVLEAQLMSGSFEYALDYLIDHELDLSHLDRRYHTTTTGSSAYDPRVLLKIILLAYSRSIERACRENVFSWHCPAIARRNSPPWLNACANYTVKSPNSSPKPS